MGLREAGRDAYLQLCLIGDTLTRLTLPAACEPLWTFKSIWQRP